MSSNVNLITICSLVIGNNLPMRSDKDKQQAELPEMPEQQQAVPSEAVVNDDGQEVAKGKEKTAGSTKCIYRGLIKKVLVVGVLALVLSRWCRSRRDEPDAA